MLLRPLLQYGQKFGIILEGTVTLWRDRNSKNDKLKTVLCDSDRESVFGFMSGALAVSLIAVIHASRCGESNTEPECLCVCCEVLVLRSEQFKQIAKQTKDWNVQADTYLDLAWLSREDLIWCFKEAWPQGYDEMVMVSFAHYEVTEELALTLGTWDPVRGCSRDPHTRGYSAVSCICYILILRQVLPLTGVDTVRSSCRIAGCRTVFAGGE